MFSEDHIKTTIKHQHEPSEFLRICENSIKSTNKKIYKFLKEILGSPQFLKDTLGQMQGSEQRGINPSWPIIDPANTIASPPIAHDWRKKISF